MKNAALLKVMIVFSLSCSQPQIKHSYNSFKNIPATAFKFDKYYINVDSVNHHRNRAHITFYSIATGKVLNTQTFSMICQADKKKPIYINDLERQIKAYDGKNIYIKTSANTMNCLLMPVN
ncbi:hypothetical protein LJ707_18820 [Mucilaginibacter sp. UR6-1]|uniref:hypothetical protein n=1 Tax=Mucilaginibacter sp. UR6-1 TaxID=1435643 RepID=UPI001E652264|nr:hypothetical protein [Mucilaginibacter sp. UR6-1]MCC8411000.1 hypothetical protein [Mucilaginibacter sp. UR6-1]